jgi:hypothetical protein
MDKLTPALRQESNAALEGLTEPFWDLLEACWGDPSSRPIVTEVVEALDTFAREISRTSGTKSTVGTTSEPSQSRESEEFNRELDRLCEALYHVPRDTLAIYLSQADGRVTLHLH